MRAADLQREVQAKNCPWSGTWGQSNPPSLMDIAAFLFSDDGSSICRKDKCLRNKFWRLPSRGLVSKAMREYAAGDAWVTIHAWDRLQTRKKGGAWVGVITP
jgi:hypothetical protein